MILYLHYPVIGSAIVPLVLVNALMEEMVRNMRARRERFIKVLNSGYVYIPE